VRVELGPRRLVEDEVEEHHGPVPEAVGGGHHLRGRTGDEPGQDRQRRRRPHLRRGQSPARRQLHAGTARPDVDPDDLGAQLHRRPCPDGRVGQRLAHLPEAAAGVQERALGGIGGPDELPGDRGRRRRRDATPGHLPRQLGAVDPPELAGVGPVERVVDGRAEACPHHLGVGVGAGMAQRGDSGVERHPGGQGGRQMAQEVRRPQREAHEAAGHRDPSTAGAQLEVATEEPLELGQEAGLDAGVEAVAAEVDALTGHLERGRQPAHDRGPLDHLMARPGRMPGRQQAGRSGPDDDDQTGGGSVRTAGRGRSCTSTNRFVARVRAT
jgi:hypothetical protein